MGERDALEELQEIRGVGPWTAGHIFYRGAAPRDALPLGEPRVVHGFAHAAEAILGEAVGQRDREAFRRGMRVVFLWAGIVGMLNLLIYAYAGHGIIALMTGIPEVRAAAGNYLLWPVLMPLVSVWAYTYDGVYLAATQTKIMRNTMLASFAAELK